MKKLSKEEVTARLAAFPQWKVDGERLFREFTFSSFARAFGFMTSVAIVCETMDHHPEWLNVYTTLKVWLSSHEVAGISERDFELAERIDSLPVG